MKLKLIELAIKLIPKMFSSKDNIADQLMTSVQVVPVTIVSVFWIPIIGRALAKM